MPRLRFAVSARFSSALILAFALAGPLTCARAAELGETVVSSHIGQPLVADIELTHLADPIVPVQVRLAHPDVYKGANIVMHPVLSNLNMSVMRRDGRQFLHITSTKQVDSQYVHLFLELIEGSKRNIRTETLWLTPDPSPAPPPEPLPRPQPQPLVLPAPAQAPVKPEASAPAAAKPAARPEMRPQPDAPPVRVLKLPPAAPASCPSAEQVKACAETDYKNGLLSAQIVELEEKVKALELAMKGAAVPPASVIKAAAAKAPPPLPKTAAKAASAKDEGFPWLIAGGIAGLLAIVGAAVFFFLRRRRKGAAPAGDGAAPQPSWYALLAARLRRKKDAAAPLEPKLPDA